MHKRIYYLVRFSILISLCSVLSILDTFLSKRFFVFFPYLYVFIPNFKIGLANIIVMYFVFYEKKRDGLLCVILKSIFSNFLFGGWISFVIGLNGSVLSFIIMQLVKNTTYSKKNIYITSVLGGFFHSLGQLLGAFFLYGLIQIQNGFSFFLLYSPILLFVGAFSGFIMAIIFNKIPRKTLFEETFLK